MKFAFIKQHLAEFGVTVVCRVLGVSRAGYYAWSKREPSARSKGREELAEKIGRIHKQNRCVYSSPQ